MPMHSLQSTLTRYNYTTKQEGKKTMVSSNNCQEGEVQKRRIYALSTDDALDSGSLLLKLQEVITFGKGNVRLIAEVRLEDSIQRITRQWSTYSRGCKIVSDASQSMSMARYSSRYQSKWSPPSPTTFSGLIRYEISGIKKCENNWGRGSGRTWAQKDVLSLLPQRLIDWELVL